jgi:hypothetical protein
VEVIMNKMLSLVMIASFFVLLFQVVALAESVVFEQYLVDVDCANKAIADNGTNLQTNPAKHTVACLKKPSCMASGYGVIIRNKETGKYNFYKFNEKGDEIARKLLETTKKTDNMQIKVRGTIENSMIIKVKSIEEK